MRRWIVGIVLVLVAIFILVGLVLYFAYGISEAPPSRGRIVGLEQPAEIHWHGDGTVTLNAASPADRMATLGYAHGMKARWTVSLLRQSALGRLGEWFGPDVLYLDRISRTLGFARNALRSYERLEAEERAILDAYTRGMNAALLSRSAVPREFASLDILPERWEPWHSLAIERLYAWMSTRIPPPDSLHGYGPAIEEFLRQEQSLRDFLHLGGFDFGVAWTVRDSAAVMLVQRQVTGASALPTLFEVVLSSDSLDSVVGASIPGTPFFPAGRTRTHAWALIPSSVVTINRVSADHTRVDTLYDRIVLDRADETLHRTPMLAGGLAFEAGSPTPPSATVTADTARAAPPAAPAAPRTAAAADTSVAPERFLWQVSWPGFEPGSDLTPWMALLTGNPLPFRIQEGAGILLNRSGDAQVLGAPRFVESYSGGLFVGQQELSRQIVDRLDSVRVGEEDLEVAPPYLDDCHSSWAATHAPRLVQTIDETFRHQRFMEEALTYLRNWDYSYDRSSIAASIFDSWVSAYVDSTGSFPDRAAVDTSYVSRYQLYNVLVAALNDLARAFGRDMSQWRWEVRMPHRYFFPVWSHAALTGVEESVLPETRYAPIEIAGNGHPTTPCWGPSPVQREGPFPSAWESWVSTASWDDYRLRRRRLDRDAFLARYRISDGLPPVTILGSGATRGRVTSVLPAD